MIVREIEVLLTAIGESAFAHLAFPLPSEPHLWVLWHITHRESIIGTFLMTWCIVKGKSGNGCARETVFEEFNFCFGLLEKVITIKISITVFSCPEINPGFHRPAVK